MPVLAFLGIESLADLLLPTALIGGGYLAYQGIKGAGEGVHEAAQDTTSMITTLALIGGAVFLIYTLAKKA